MTKIAKKLITHDGSFHADDVFACAIICLFLEKNNEEFEIIRSRDPKVIETGDYVFDIGGIYDNNTNHFDHHQIGGAGRRVPGRVEGEKGIEYAACGLVWKKLGIELCGSEKVVEIVDRRLFAPIDAGDNGFDLVQNLYEISPYFIQHAIQSMRPTWREADLSENEMFLKSVEIAKTILTREIIQAEDAVVAEEMVISIYKNTEDKRIIILDKNYPYEYTLHDFPEPIFVIHFKESSKQWMVRAMRKDSKTFINRKNFPKLWAGLRDDELQNVTGVRDAIFCHRGLFLAVANSKEGAIELAKIALAS